MGQGIDRHPWDFARSSITCCCLTAIIMSIHELYMNKDLLDLFGGAKKVERCEFRTKDMNRETYN